LEDAAPPLVARKVGEWVVKSVGSVLEERGKRLVELQSQSQLTNPASLELARDFVATSDRLSAPVAAEEDDAPTQVHELSSQPSAPAPFVPVPEVKTPISHISVLSEVSNASYTTPPPERRPGRRLLPIAIALAALALVVVVGAIVLLFRSPTPDKGIAAAPPESVQAPPATTLEPVAEPEPVVAQSAEPEPESAMPAKPEPASSTVAPKPATTPKVTSKPVTKPKPKNCDPPYTIENGIKKFKMECL
jgi:hypothetical protein